MEIARKATFFERFGGVLAIIKKMLEGQFADGGLRPNLDNRAKLLKRVMVLSGSRANIFLRAELGCILGGLLFWLES
jgi:hypothetical protein